MGIGRSTPRQEAAQTHAADVLGRLQWQLAELRASLDKIAVAHAAMAAELVSCPGASRL
jgi:hypothetical protein